MSILSELNTVLAAAGVPAETGVFSGEPPDEYAVVTPLSDTFDFYADDLPRTETQEARLSLFCKSNYIKMKNRLVSALLQAGFGITDRRYIGHEDDTKYHQYAIDVAKNYEVED